MKTCMFIVSMMTFSGGAALAGGVVAPVFEQPVAVGSTAIVMAPPVWAGGYVGGNLGYGMSNIDAQDVLARQADARGIGRTLFKPDGVTGALRGGYDWQRGQYVFGVGAEYAIGKVEAGLEDGDTATTLGGPQAKISQIGRVFGRVGFATGPWLPYVLLGYTTANLDISGPDGGEGDIDGATIGLGLERRFTGNLSGYGEYSYSDFGDVAGANDQISADLNEVKLGVNYRF